MEKQVKTIRWDILNIIAFFGIAWMFYGLWSIRSFLVLFALALFLSVFIEDFILFFEQHHVPRYLAVPIIYLIAFLLFAGSLFLFIPIIDEELGKLIQLYPSLGSVFHSVKEFSLQLGSFSSLSRETLQQAFEVFADIFGGVVNFGIVFVMSFYLSIHKNSVDRVLRILTPRQYEDRVLKLWHSIKRKVSAWFKGQMILSLVVFVISYIGLLLMNVPYALLLSLLAGIFGLVPYGIVLATIPALILSFNSGGFRLMLMTLVFYILVLQFVDYFIQPLLSKRLTGVPSVMVVVSVIASTKLFGVTGLILAIPIAISILEILKAVEEGKKKRRGL